MRSCSQIIKKTDIGTVPEVCKGYFVNVLFNLNTCPDQIFFKNLFVRYKKNVNCFYNL